VPQYTLADLEDSVYSTLDDNTLFYPQAEVDRAINEALRVVNCFTGFLQTSAVVSGGTDALRVYYRVPDGILFPLAVHWSGRQLRRNSLPAVASKYRDWTDRPSSVFGAPADWIPIGTRTFAIHPQDSVAANVLTVYGVSQTTALSAGSDVVQLEDEATDAVSHLAAHTLQIKEGGKVFADSSLHYQEFLHEMKAKERWRRITHPRYWVEVESVKEA
jgi:hypothetical protein